MKILFEMPYPGYMRMYGSTVRLLGERGHTVCVSYDSPDKRSDVPLIPPGSPDTVSVVQPIPWNRGVWAPLVRFLRLGSDYGRFLAPRFANAAYLRRRMEKFLPPRARFLIGMQTKPQWLVRLALRASAFLEHAIPIDRDAVRFLKKLKPDVVLVTPVITRGDNGVRQTDTVKAARQVGIPVAIAVGSWDHLSSKGQIHYEPDQMFVWNETQKAEASQLHDVPAEKVVVTGAQLFDQWFAQRPTRSREEFLAPIGLDPARPYVLYVGSSRGIADPAKELTFVTDWVSAVRKSEDPALRDIGILIRPHPFNMDHWQTADLSQFGNVSVWPRTRPSFPMNAEDEATYFESLYYSAGIMGINTSAMIEAAIVGRPVYTIRVPAFADTQEGTLHFHYLLPDTGGFLRVAWTTDEHLRQLADNLARMEAVEDEIKKFVGSFVRPHGFDRPCTPILADAVEQLGRSGARTPSAPPLWALPLRGALFGVASLMFAADKWSARTQAKKPAKKKKTTLVTPAAERPGAPV